MRHVFANAIALALAIALAHASAIASANALAHASANASAHANANANVRIRPTVVVIDGALQYQPAILRPLSLSGISGKLEKLGFRVIASTHLGEGLIDEEPVMIVGHSAGGAAALRAAKMQAEQAKYRPLVITLDAAPWWSGIGYCPVDICINIKTAGYPDIRGARNVTVAAMHALLPFDVNVQSIVMKYAAPLSAPMR